MKQSLKPIIFINSLLFLFSSSSIAAGIWTRTLDIEGVADFTALHMQMAVREARLTEDLITLQEFKGPTDQHLQIFEISEDNDRLTHREFYDRSTIKFEVSGDLLFPNELEGISKEIKKLCGKFRSKNVALASISAVSTSGEIATREIKKDYHYRFRIGRNNTFKKQVILGKSPEVFLSRGEEHNQFTAMFQGEATDDYTSSVAYSSALAEEVSRIALATGDKLAHQIMSEKVASERMRVDSEEELLMYLFSPVRHHTTTFVPTFAKFKDYLIELRNLVNREDPINFIALNIHSRFDACPVCLMRLHYAFSSSPTGMIEGLANIVTEVFDENVKFFITYSSREDYIHDGKSQKRVGITASTVVEKLNRSELGRLIDARQIIQTAIDPFLLYLAMDNEDRRIPFIVAHNNREKYRNGILELMNEDAIDVFKSKLDIYDRTGYASTWGHYVPEATLRKARAIADRSKRLSLTRVHQLMEELAYLVANDKEAAIPIEFLKRGFLRNSPIQSRLLAEDGYEQYILAAMGPRSRSVLSTKLRALRSPDWLNACTYGWGGITPDIFDNAKFIANSSRGSLTEMEVHTAMEELARKIDKKLGISIPLEFKI